MKMNKFCEQKEKFVILNCHPRIFWKSHSMIDNTFQGKHNVTCKTVFFSFALSADKITVISRNALYHKIYQRATF